MEKQKKLHLKRNGKAEKTGKWKLNFLRFHHFSPCTRGFLFYMCTGQHNMQGASSTSLTDLLDRGAILMDVREIQGRNWYFAKFGVDFGWCLQIQGRSWWFTPDMFFLISFSAHCIREKIFLALCYQKKDPYLNNKESTTQYQLTSSTYRIFVNECG